MSRVNFGAKPNMYPLPVLIIATYDKDGNPDAMNAAWGVVTDFNEISISMGDHKTTDNLAATGAFTAGMPCAHQHGNRGYCCWLRLRRHRVRQKSSG